MRIVDKSQLKISAVEMRISLCLESDLASIGLGFVHVRITKSSSSSSSELDAMDLYSKWNRITDSEI